MKAEAVRGGSATRPMSIVMGAAGWTLMILLTACRLTLGAPHDTGLLVAGLARSSQRREEALRQPQPEPRRRGYIGDRPFVANDDGSVTVETLLGPRHFPSLADAQDFIGS